MPKLTNRFVTPSLFALSVVGFMCFLPAPALADSIELQRVLPEVDEDITPPDNQKAGEENFYTFWFKGQIGTEYSAAFTVSEEPAFTFVSGGNMNLDNNIYYNSENSTFSVTWTAEELEQIDANSGLELEEGQTLTIVAVSFPVAEGEAGPGDSTVGSWLATNFQEWSLVTPSEDINTLGAQVSGDAGDEGRFKMFIPQVSLDAMTTFDGGEEGEYTADDFAVFEDETFTVEGVEAVEGGALVNFTAIIPDKTGAADFRGTNLGIQDGPGSSLLVEVGPQDNVSMISDKTSVREGRYITLTGWLKNGKRGKTVTLLSRTEDSSYTQVASTETVKNGKFTFTVKVWEASAFKAKFRTHKSQALQVTIW